MKGLFQSNNRMYCLTNIFVCVLCTGYLYTGYCSVNNEIQQDLSDVIVENDLEPLSGISDKKELFVVKEEPNKIVATTTKVVTTSKTNTSSKKYVKPNYDSVTGSAVVDYAKNYLGLRYVSGGNSLTKGTDCSGFTKLIYKEFGINLSRSVKAQAKNGTYVKKSDLQKGDLIFYGYKSGVVSHVAIYIGDGKVIHQSTPKYGVKINSMNMMVYITARRVITKPATTSPNTSKDTIKEESSNIDKNENINNDILNNKNENENINNNIDTNINNSVNENSSIDNNINNNNNVDNNVNNNNVNTNNNNNNNIDNNNNTPDNVIDENKETNNNQNTNSGTYTSNEYKS